MYKLYLTKLFYISDLSDFDNTVIRITFEPDENAGINERAAPIAVVNDLINEADEQVFVVELRLISSTNPAAIDLTTRPASQCRIINNDGKPNNAYCEINKQSCLLHSCTIKLQQSELVLSSPPTCMWNLCLRK